MSQMSVQIQDAELVRDSLTKFIHNGRQYSLFMREFPISGVSRPEYALTMFGRFLYFAVQFDSGYFIL
jgi:hypothetical protein